MSTPTAIPSAAPEAPSQHDARGRFVKGNKGGPGNPLAGKVNSVRLAFLDYFDESTIHLLCEFMFRRAVKGDPRFLRIILQYTIGKLPSDEGGADMLEADEAFDRAQAESEVVEPDAGTASAAQAAQDNDVQTEREPAGDPVAMGQQAGHQPDEEPDLAAPLATGLANVVKQPPSKNRDRLLRLIEDRDPVAGDAWALPPSTNGVGVATNVPLAGT